MIAALAALLLQDAIPLESLKPTKGQVEGAAGAIAWSPGGSGASLETSAIPQDWTGFKSIEIKIFNPAATEKRFDLRLESAPPSKYWRRWSIKGEGWQDVVIELYTLRREDGPIASDIRRLVIEARQEGTCRIGDIRLVRSPLGWIEPDDALIARAFPKKAPNVYRNAKFRVFSEVPLKGDELLSRLDELRRRFDAHFPKQEGPDLPATLVIFRDRSDFKRFCEQSAEQLFGAEARVRGIGHHVQDCAASFWSETLKEQRPIYIHEVAHVLISRRLRLDTKQKWFQEGLATYFQTVLMDDVDRAKVARGVREMGGRERVGLKYVDAGLAPSGAEYLQYMSLIEFLFRQAGADAVVEAMQSGASLKDLVKKHLRQDLDAFEQSWLDFCRNYK